MCQNGKKKRESSSICSIAPSIYAAWEEKRKSEMIIEAEVKAVVMVGELLQGQIKAYNKD